MDARAFELAMQCRNRSLDGIEPGVVDQIIAVGLLLIRPDDAGPAVVAADELGPGVIFVVLLLVHHRAKVAGELIVAVVVLRRS